MGWSTSRNLPSFPPLGGHRQAIQAYIGEICLVRRRLELEGAVESFKPSPVIHVDALLNLVAPPQTYIDYIHKNDITTKTTVYNRRMACIGAGQN